MSGTGLDEILARSRAPGAFVERRTFTLSRGKALEKQREFALRHPSQYVLEIVQSAIFAEATYLALDARRDSMLLAWVGGRPFQRNELENVLDWLFWDRGDQSHRHLVQLAVGVNALLQRKPKLLRIESGDGTTSVRLDLDAAGNATVGTPEKPIAGTYVHAVHTVGWLQRFMGGGPVDEIELVERRCSYLPVPILVNGSAPFGYRASRHLEVFGAAHQRSFDQDGRRGVVALVGNRTHASAVAGFRMVVGGVWISTLPLDQMCGKVPLSGVLCDDRLRKTADQSDVVQDARFVQLLHAVQPIAGELVQSALGPQAWNPPRLPPIPEEVEERPAPAEAPAEPVVTLEPVPDHVPAVAPRFAVAREQLGARGGGPLFRVDPGQAEQLAEALAPHRFPWCVVVLTEGQAATLARDFEEAVPPRLATRADVDFVTRALERSIVTRDHLERIDGDELIVRLHLEGPMPDWGLGRPGVPFCVIGPEGTVEHGVLRDGRVLLAGGTGKGEDRELVGPPLDLPRISLILRTEQPGRTLDARHVQDAREAARLLVGEASTPVERELLAALLGDRAIPQLVAGPDGPTLAIAPPPGWTPSLADRTLPGGVTLRELVATVVRGEVIGIGEGDGLPAKLDPLERKLGFGHLAHPSLRGRFVAGVVRTGGQWREVDPDVVEIFSMSSQAVLVTATLEAAPPEGFTIDQRFGGAVIGVVSVPGWVGEDWEGGLHALFELLQHRLGERSLVRAGLSPHRCEGMGRLALLELVERLGRAEDPLLIPTDGGGLRSLHEIRTHAAARVVARHGIRVAEPWTFAVTLDELRRIRLEGSDPGPALRYDDDPGVWHDLPEGELGWLLREDFRAGGLKGWLGLRLPFDPTTGILLRTTGALVALSDLERTLPCHGLVWPSSGQELHAEQRRLVQLAGWRLYQQLVNVLDERGAPERIEAARQYASAFVALAWERSHQLQGTAADLARRVPVEGVGSLLDWYEAGNAPQTAIERVAPPQAPVVARAMPDLEARLTGAFPVPGLLVSVVEVAQGHRAPPATLGAESQRAHACIEINAEHPLCVAALSSNGPAREVLLLEAARLVAQHLRATGRDASIGVAHQLLVGQRFDPA